SSSSASTPVVIVAASPVTTSTSPSKPSRLSRAAAAASPVPRGSRCTATVTPSNASLASGAVTTTSGSGPSPRVASITQSARRRPGSGCRCFGVSERMRVPSPAARTTAASFEFVTEIAGAPGFEPGIAGPKPAALPLGYAPPSCVWLSDIVCWTAAPDTGTASRRRRKRRLGTWLPRISGESLAPVVEEKQQGDSGEDRGEDERQPAEQDAEDHDHHGEALGGAGDPGNLVRRVRLRVAAPEGIEREDRDRDRD